MIENTAALALWLSAGAYAPVVASEPLAPLFQTPEGGAFNGVRIGMTSAQWEDGELANLASYGELDARFYLDDRGVFQVDQLRLESGLASLRVRPLLGDGLDLALLGGAWDTTWSYIDIADLQVQVYSPTVLTLLGFSNTDFDDDKVLKHYFAAGIGPGVRVTGRVVGPFGVFGHAEALGRSFNRHQADAKNQVRHEASAEGSLGLGYFADESSVLLGGWGEIVTQWETRDRDGMSGVDRQYAAFGVTLTVLTTRQKQTDLDDELEELKRQGLFDGDLLER
jgi:hypothetical protein